MKSIVRKFLSTKKHVFSVTLFMIVFGLLCFGLYNHRASDNSTYSLRLSSNALTESHVLVVGDIYWGRQVYDWSMQSNLKEKYPFSRLQEFQRDKYDAWIGNLECPSVPSVKQPVGFKPELSDFNCDTSFMPEFAKWFSVVSLANNHTSNQGREVGQESTRDVLDQNGIQWFGGFNPHKKDTDVCKVITLPARAMVDGEQKSIKLPVAMCGYHGVHYSISSSSIEQIAEYAKYMPVIAMPHMGVEYQATIDLKRQELYRAMIDQGADAVIGNHPHWVQPVEAYKGKLIAYSMGNFIFDQDFSAEVMRSAAFDITLSANNNDTTSHTLKKWIELGKTCSSKDCLEQAKQMNLSKIPMKFSYDIVGVSLEGKITHKANQQQLESLYKRLNWQEVQKTLN